MHNILLSPPDMTGKEQKFIQEAFDKNYIAPVGHNIDLFEKEIAHYVKTKYAVAVSSGTSGLHLALIASGIQKGDTVLCSDLTFSASVNPIFYIGAIPVLIDSELETWNMDPDLLEQSITEYTHLGNKPKAVIVTHIYGQSAKMKEIMSICRKYNIRVIEDSCESLGTISDGRMTGSIGDIGVYSFNGNKIITTSGGGMIVTDDEEIAKKIKYLSTQAKSNVPYYLHEEIGYNYRLSNILAGIGRGQLLSLESKIQKRRQIYQRYLEELTSIPVLKMMPKDEEKVRSNRWLSVFTADEFDPISSINYFKEKKIETRAVWNPLHNQPYITSRRVTYYTKENIGDRLFSSGLCLPSGSNLTELEQEYVIEQVKEYFKKML
ncbi:aminotransferase class I/II-fold pyridoxal phosphate-dependent enzyme [Enterococcus faecium]|nr:aminotransferase class I/II-fold pyridoxal phosphate-dependent enzyme [Enterococcus faecium]